MHILNGDKVDLGRNTNTTSSSWRLAPSLYTSKTSADELYYSTTESFSEVPRISLSLQKEIMKIPDLFVQHFALGSSIAFALREIPTWFRSHSRDLRVRLGRWCCRRPRRHLRGWSLLLTGWLQRFHNRFLIRFRFVRFSNNKCVIV